MAIGTVYYTVPLRSVLAGLGGIMPLKILTIISIVRAVADRSSCTLRTHRLLRGYRFCNNRYRLATCLSCFYIVRRAVGCHRYIAIQVGAVHNGPHLGQVIIGILSPISMTLIFGWTLETQAELDDVALPWCPTLRISG